MAARESILQPNSLARRWYRVPLHPRVVAIIGFVLLWELVALFFPEHVFPSLGTIGKTLWAVLTGGQLVHHVGTTLGRLVTGFFLALAAGVTLGILMGVSEFWDRFSHDYVMIGLTVPGLIWAVLAAFWFGLSPVGPVFAVMVVVYPFIAINVYEGVRSVDRYLLDMCRVYRVPRLRMMWRLMIPSLLPFLLAAVRYGFAIGWKIVTLTEVYGATSGLGYMIRRNHDMFSIRGVIAWSTVFTALLLITEHGILRPVERRLFRWRTEAMVR